MLTTSNLEEWQQWHQRRQGWLRRLRVSLPQSPKARLLIYSSTNADNQRPVLVTLDSIAASQRAALLRPAELLIHRGIPVMIVAPEGVGRNLQDLDLAPVGSIDSEGRATMAIPRALSVLSGGHYMPAGWFGWSLSRAQEIPYLVVQHGVLTPHAPPLPPETHLLAWSPEDAQFWSSRRRDVMNTVVGSQSLWEAARVQAVADPSAPLVFLGQLHGAELPRAVTVRTVRALRGKGEFVYRPHPGELDWRSRCQHTLWRSQGVTLDDVKRPLTSLGAPVGAVFSTGILEAAAAGLPAYGVCEGPPAWIHELWSRYGIERPDSGCRTQVDVPTLEPAQSIADIAGDAR